MNNQIEPMFSSGPVVVFKWDLDISSVIYISDNVEKIFAYTKTEILSGSSFWLNEIEKNTISEISKLIQRIELNKLDNYVLDLFEIKFKNKSIKYVKLYIQVERNDKNEIAFFSGYLIDITDEVKSKKRLTESEEKYRTIAENSTDVIFLISETGEIVYVNEIIKKLINKEVSDVIGKNFKQYIPLSEVPCFLKQLTQIFLGKGVKNFRTLVYNNDNVSVPIEISGKLVTFNDKKVGLGVIRNISEQISYENELKKLSSAVEFSASGIVITNSEGVIEYVNSRYKEIAGLGDNNIIGATHILFTKRQIDLLALMKAMIKENGYWKDEFYRKKMTGELYWEQISVAPIYKNKEDISKYIMIIQDVTSNIEAEKVLIAAKEKAEGSDRLKSAFMANVSHELRTPLNGIIGFAEVLKLEDASFEEQKEYANIIYNSGDYLLNLINNIVNYSELEAKQVIVLNRIIDIEDLFVDMKDTFKPILETKNIDFKCEIINKDQKKDLVSDELKLKQILINLINNAIKFTEKGFVRYTCKFLEEKIVFKIQDTGIGIHEDNIKRIFMRFYQEHKSFGVYRGTGLGLSIVKEYVALLGGIISVESEIDKGSLFTIELPYHVKNSNT